jgi:hypothetical protein
MAAEDALMSVIPLPMCKRCGEKPATHKACCDTCWPEEKAANEMGDVLSNSDQQNHVENFSG